MTGGFALVAWPAQYDVTGVMTFIVSDEGVVREKDLGPDTDAARRRITTYNPMPHGTRPVNAQIGDVMKRVGQDTDVKPKARAPQVGVRAAMGAESIGEALLDNLYYLQAKRRSLRRATMVHGACVHRSRSHVEPVHRDPRNDQRASDDEGCGVFVSRIPHGPQLGNGLVNLGLWKDVEEAVSKVGQNLAALLEQEEEPGLGTAASDVWPRATWIRCRRSTSRRSATASATSSASSIRRFATAGR
jgi:hypothetical protein